MLRGGAPGSRPRPLTVGQGWPSLQPASTICEPVQRPPRAAIPASGGREKAATAQGEAPSPQSGLGFPPTAPRRCDPRTQQAAFEGYAFAWQSLVYTLCRKAGGSDAKGSNRSRHPVRRSGFQSIATRRTLHAWRWFRLPIAPRQFGCAGPFVRGKTHPSDLKIKNEKRRFGDRSAAVTVHLSNRGREFLSPSTVRARRTSVCQTTSARPDEKV